MSVKCSDILDFADQLLQNSKNNEVIYRNVIGRAYYACFHKASEFYDALSSGGVVKENTGVHDALITALINPSVSEKTVYLKSKSIGYMCKELKLQRVEADYKLKKDITKTDAEIIVGKAYNLFEKINSH